MGNVVCIGDSISCGDHTAEGSSNVFAANMPITTAAKKTTTGHGCFPPTVLIGPFSSTVFVNGSPVALKGKAKIQTHRCGNASHDGVVTTAAATVSIEE